MRHLKWMMMITLTAVLFHLLHWQILPLGTHTLINISIASLAGWGGYSCFAFAQYLWQHGGIERYIAVCYMTGAGFGAYFFMKYATTIDIAPLYPRYMKELAVTTGIFLIAITILLHLLRGSTSSRHRARAG